ncbi:MAG: FAD-dependent oxidoreductase [Chloroflexota bacterium]
MLPSKVWLGGVEGHGRSITPERVLGRLQETRARWNEQRAQMLQALGVDVVTGSAVFTGPSSLTVTHEDESTSLTADSFIVASGSVPIFPEDLKPDGRQVLAPRFMSGLTELPQSMTVIGAGSTGCEFAHLFNALGLEVNWIVDEFGVLPAYHPDAGKYLTETLVGRGVKLFAGQQAAAIDRLEDGVGVHLSDGTTVSSDTAFVAIGRKPDTDRLRLDQAGIVSGTGPVSVDAYGRSQNPIIYLTGDATGGPMVANKAMAQARIAVLDALGRNPEPYDPRLLVLATYTQPEIAQVGEVDGEHLAEVRMNFDQSLKPWLLPHQTGFINLFYDKVSRELAGGLAVGYHAADVLAPCRLR